MDLYVSNNPLVFENAETNSIKDSLVYLEPEIQDGYMNVLNAVRDLVHKGHKLLTHPLSGSIKPGETPYKTVILHRDQGELDMDSLRITEEAILTARKLGVHRRRWTEEILQDFQLIDYTLVFDKIKK